MCKHFNFFEKFIDYFNIYANCIPSHNLKIFVLLLKFGRNSNLDDFYRREQNSFFKALYFKNTFSSLQGYPDRLTESRVLPETFVSLFLRCYDSNRSLQPYFAFLADHCQTNVERIATFNDVTRLIHQLLLRLDGSNNAGIIRGLRWVFSDVLKTASIDSKPPDTPNSVSYSQLMELLQVRFPMLQKI